MLPFQEHGIQKKTGQVLKYNSPAAQVYKKKVQALAEGRPWQHEADTTDSTLTGNDSIDVINAHRCLQENRLGPLDSSSLQCTFEGSWQAVSRRNLPPTKTPFRHITFLKAPSPTTRR